MDLMDFKDLTDLKDLEGVLAILTRVSVRDVGGYIYIYIYIYGVVHKTPCKEI